MTKGHQVLLLLQDMNHGFIIMLSKTNNNQQLSLKMRIRNKNDTDKVRAKACKQKRLLLSTEILDWNSNS